MPPDTATVQVQGTKLPSEISGDCVTVLLRQPSHSHRLSLADQLRMETQQRIEEATTFNHRQGIQSWAFRPARHDFPPP